MVTKWFLIFFGNGMARWGLLTRMDMIIFGLIMLTYSLTAWRFRLWDSGLRWIDIEPKPWMYALTALLTLLPIFLGLFLVL